MAVSRSAVSKWGLSVGRPNSRSSTPSVAAGASGFSTAGDQARRARNEAPFMPAVTVARARAARHR